MNRRIFLAKAGAGLSGLTLSARSSEAASARRRPNILLIVADDWGWGDLSCHSHPEFKTPHLDRMAAQGTDFRKFTVNNPVCSPSRTALMTGQYPARWGVHQHFAWVELHIEAGMPDWLDPQAPLLPRMLRKAGYATGHFGKWHLTNTRIQDAPLPDQYGYDEYGAFNLPGDNIKVNQACPLASDFIRRHKDQPFFVNLWIHETHTPHHPTAASLERFKYLDEQQRVYAAVVADADTQIGRVLDTLREAGQEENTLVIFASDNGPEITGKRTKRDDDLTRSGLGTYFSVGSTGGHRGRKRSLYQGGVGVPFIARWPGKVPAGRVDEDTIITAVDLLPTLCAVADVPLPGGYQPDGENLLDALRGKRFSRSKPIFWEWRGYSGGDNWPRLAVWDGPWKLLMDPATDRVELYALKDDPFEADNVAGAHPEVVDRLSRILSDWKRSLPEKPPAHCFSSTRSKEILAHSTAVAAPVPRK